MDKLPIDKSTSTENTPHSGNLPGELNDQPYHIFDNTSLEEATKLTDESGEPLLKTPDTAADLLPKKSRKGLFIGLSSVAVGAAGVIVAVNSIFGGPASAPNEVPKDEPVATAPSNPIETSKPVATVAPVEAAPLLNNDPVPADLQPLMPYNAEQLSLETSDTKLKYLSYATRNVKPFAEEFEKVSGSPLDKYPTEPLSIDSTPQDIITAQSYIISQAYTQPTIEEGEKLLAASFIDGVNSPTYQLWKQKLEALPNYPFTVKGLANTGVFTSPKFVSSTGIQQRPDGAQYQDITWVENHTDLYGNPVTVDGTSRYYYEEFTNYKGEPEVAWIFK